MDAADGLLDEHDGRWRLRFERRLHHPPDRVWRAITEPDGLRAWFPFDFDAPRALELEWGGGERLRLEVRAEGEGSILTLVNTFDEQGKAARDGAGWHACLDALAEHLDGAGAPAAPEERWARLHDAYRERFGPAASTIGPPA